MAIQPCFYSQNAVLNRCALMRIHSRIRPLRRMLRIRRRPAQKHPRRILGPLVGIASLERLRPLAVSQSVTPARSCSNVSTQY